MDCSAIGAQVAAPGRGAFAWAAPAEGYRPAHASLCMTCPVRVQCIGGVAAEAGTRDLLAVLAGRRLLKAGEGIELATGGVCVVRRGSLKSLVPGTDVARGFHFPGESIVADACCATRLVALEDAELCVMHAGPGREGRASLGRLWDMTSRELVRERAQAGMLASLSPVRRVTTFLAQLAVRARVPGLLSPALVLHLSAADIAAFLQVPGETVGRVLAVLTKREVLLPRHRYLVVANLEMLQFAARQG
jgi:CRP-like cAMP-binding protein